MTSSHLSKINVGDRVRGHDDDYEVDLEGVVTDISGRGGFDTAYVMEAMFVNELPGPFAGKRVGLAFDKLEVL